MRIIGCALSALVLASCSQSDAPSDVVEEAAEEIVEAAQGIEPEAEEAALGPYAPRDECSADESSAAFVAALKKAVTERDTDALVALAADDIKLDFGGGEGAEELRARLDSEGSSLWFELDALMPLGCARNEHGGITIPWFFAQEMDDDPYQAMIVTGVDVPLLAREDGSTLAKVTWDDVLLVESWNPELAFQGVSYGEIEEAYIATAKLRSPIDFRLIASSRNGEWSITGLVAGD